jgi:AcrR family transcriptional regulator
MASGIQRRQAMREQAREAILAAALEVFGASSFTQGTTADIAAKAGVSKGLVFNYFPTKEALLQGLVEKMLGESLDFWDAQTWHGPPAEQLTAWIDTAIAQVLRRPDFYRLYFSLSLQPGGSAAVDAALASLEPRLSQYLARAQALMERLGSSDPSSDARLLQCAINGLAQVITAGPATTASARLIAVEPLKARLAEIFMGTCGREKA